MIPGAFRLLAMWLGLALLLAVPRAALAAGFAPGSACHAAAAAGENYAALAARPGRWTCSGSGWSVAAPRAFLRLDLRGADTAAEMLTTRLTRFRAARLTVIAADGTSASRDLTEANMVPATGDWLMRTPLPQVAGERVAVVLRVDEARHAGMLSDARLEDGADTPASLRHELAVAMLCGTLLLPLLFNLAFYRILRERFLLWHMLSTAFMLAHTLITSGLVNRFVTLSLEQLSVASAVSVGGGIVCASLFSADLVEPGKLDAVHRRLLRCVALWVPPWTLFYLYADGPLRALSAPLYLASFLPLIALFVWAMTVARRRGSRAVNFQIAAWMPVMLTALVRIASSLGATDAPLEMLLEQHVAMGLEVIITSLGVIDRLLVIRRQRDVARAEARVLEERAERDFLTGLLNRRFVELRFDDVRAGGFHAMALLDLDRFKQINDTFGHVTGDAVLRAAAEALEPDGDTLAVRLGGEEFLLLMRGGDVPARAERRRQAIAARVAARVPGLDRIVTASMGLVEQPGDGPGETGFAALYARCDRLLYEAKGAGRNQMMREGQVPGLRTARSAPHAA